MRLSLSLFAVSITALSLFVSSCTSTQELAMQGAGATFYEGIRLLNDKSYEKARNEFNIVVKQYPASAYADSAQFYLAETYYKTDEYLTAAFEFSNVNRNYPSSKLAPEARFRIAECYAALSPRVQLDQSNTKKAIEAFQSFVDYYPNSPLVQKADSEITVLRNKLAEKNIDVAKLYMVLGDYRAAIVYYDVVLDDYHDSNVADKAAIGKVKALIERHKDDEAKTALIKFFASYPNSSMKDEADGLAKRLKIDPGQAGGLN